MLDQRRRSWADVALTLYKCYIDVLCSLGSLFSKYKILLENCIYEIVVVDILNISIHSKQMIDLA